MIGFSFGAALALDFASNNDVAGVAAISTFLEPKRKYLLPFLLKLSSLLSLPQIPNFLLRPTRTTKEKVQSSKYLNLAAYETILNALSRLRDNLPTLLCPSIFFHSVDDRIAAYKPILRLVKKNIVQKIQLIPFYRLNHYLQCDISPPALRDVILEFFGILPTNDMTEQQQHLLRETYAQCSAEYRHWTQILFQLIVGFFSILGALVYFSLADVIADTPKAPYYLAGYSLVINIYLMLFAIYFYNINRISVFMRLFLDPLLCPFPWASYKTLEWLSGRESKYFTVSTAVSIVALPLVLSLSCIVYIVSRYLASIINITSGETFLLIMTSFAIIFFLTAFRSLVILLRYNDRFLGDLPGIPISSVGLQRSMVRLYASIEPGSVTLSRTDDKKRGGME